jgi:long-chain fatty acid transport protein
MKPKKRRLKSAGLAAFCIHTILCGSAFGAGFAVMEQSVKGLGNAYAGGAAAADDASTIFYNPAGLTRLPGVEFVAGVHTLIPSARFRNEGSVHATGQPLTGGDGGAAGTTAFIPNIYYSHRINDRWGAGLGVFVPFGLNTEYDSTWVGRYHAVESDLKTVNINPAVGYRLTEKISVGAGVNLQYLKAKLSSAIDFGTIFAAFGMPGMVPQANDGFVTFKGDNWAWGYNAGALYEFSKDTRIGIAYRSRIKQKLKGDADFSGVPSPNPTGRFLDTGVKADSTLPDSLSVSYWHNVTQEFAVMADVTWTNWSTFKEIRIRFDNPVEADAVTTTEWKDSYRFGVGVVYMPRPWVFRAGAAYDKTPVPDAARSTPRIPDNDRTWLTLGLGYRITEKVSLDMGYAHLFVENPEIRKTASGEDLLRGGLSGSYESKVDIISAEVSLIF